MEFSKEHDSAMGRSNIYGASSVLSMIFGAILAACGIRWMLDTGIAISAALGPVVLIVIGLALLAVGIWCNARCEKIYQEEVRPLRRRDMGNWARENVPYETRQFVTESILMRGHSKSEKPDFKVRTRIIGLDGIHEGLSRGGHETVI